VRGAMGYAATGGEDSLSLAAYTSEGRLRHTIAVRERDPMLVTVSTYYT
jgi:hypothetical protein